MPRHDPPGDGGGYSVPWQAFGFCLRLVFSQRTVCFLQGAFKVGFDPFAFSGCEGSSPSAFFYFSQLSLDQHGWGLLGVVLTPERPAGGIQSRSQGQKGPFPFWTSRSGGDFLVGLQQ